MPNYGNLYDGSFQVGDLVEVVHSRSFEHCLQVGCRLLVTPSICESVSLERTWTGKNIEVRKVKRVMYFKDWYRETFECQK